MIVVADTSPINYLLLIKEIDILPKMYRKIVIPRRFTRNFCGRLRLRSFGLGSARRLLGSKFALPLTLQTPPWRS
jgi:hypothetical protein